MKWEGWFSPAVHTPGSVKNLPLAFALWSHKENLPYLSLHPPYHSHDWDWINDQGKKVQRDLTAGWPWPYCHTPIWLHKQESTVLASSINKSLLAATIPPVLLAGKFLSREALLNTLQMMQLTKPIGFYKNDLDNLLLLVAVMGNVHFLVLSFRVLQQKYWFCKILISFAIWFRIL